MYLSTDKLLVLQIEGICYPLQKMLHDPAGSRQTSRGPFDVLLSVLYHKQPSASSFLRPPPSGRLLRGSTDLSAGEERKDLGLCPSPDSDAHKSKREGG